MAKPAALDIFREYLSKNPETNPSSLSPETFERYRELLNQHQMLPQQQASLVQPEQIAPPVMEQPIVQPIVEQPIIESPIISEARQPVPFAPKVHKQMPAQGAFGQQMSALENIGSIEGHKAVENAKLYGQAIGEVDKIEAQRKQEFNKYQQDMDVQLQDYNSTVQELASAKVDPERFWNSRSMPQKASAFIGIMLSGIGAGMQGVAGNSALNLINRAIDADIDAQKTELDTKSKTLNYKGNLLGLMRQKYQDEGVAQAATKATMLEKLQMQMQQQAALYENPLVQERAQLAIGQLREEKAKYDTQIGLQFQNQALKRLEMDRSHQLDLMKFGLAQDEAQRKVLAGPAPEKANESQRKKAGFAIRARQAEKEFGDINGNRYDRSDIFSGIGATLPNLVRGTEAVRQEQAERNFVNAILRDESGAAISQSEFDNARQQYFPRVGDSKAVLEQKERNRKAAIASLEAGAGRVALEEAGSNFQRELENQTKTIGGKTYRKVPNGWAEVR